MSRQSDGGRGPVRSIDEYRRWQWIRHFASESTAFRVGERHVGARDGTITTLDRLIPGVDRDD